MVCSWLTRGEALKGQFGPRIQSYIEMSITNYQVLRGRPILNMIVREFDLDDALGGVISAVELFQIPSPEGDYSSLVTFRDKAQHVLTQLPIAERPSDAMLSKWLYERLKKVRSFSIIIDRIKESVAGSNERTFDYLWSRLMRHIAEQQHDKNLSSTQEDLRKGPRKTTSGATAKPEPKAKSKVETLMLQVPLPKVKAKVKVRPSLHQTPPNRRIPRTRGVLRLLKVMGRRVHASFSPRDFVVAARIVLINMRAPLLQTQRQRRWPSQRQLLWLLWWVQ